MSATLPAALGRRLYRVDRPLLVQRYRDALARLNGRASLLDAFHVDAAGWSPEIAQELGDPAYLGHGPLHPAFIVLSVDQIDCPVIQPNAGFAWTPYRQWLTSVRAELADLTLREPVFGEITHGVTRFGHPAQLGLVRGLKLSIHTPSERLAAAVDVGAMRQELLESDTRWRDEEFIAHMTARARDARGWYEVPAPLRHGRHVQSTPSYTPAFGGTYVWPGGGDNEPTAWVLCRPNSPDSESWPQLADTVGVLLLPLTPETANDFLVEHALTTNIAKPGDLTGATFDELQTFIALDHLARSGRLTPEAANHPLRAMRADPAPPADYLELEDLRLKAGAMKGGVDLSRASPLTRLRTMPLKTDDAVDRAWVLHLRAFLDPVQLPRVARDAPDLAPALLSGLSEAQTNALERALKEAPR